MAKSEAAEGRSSSSPSSARHKAAAAGRVASCGVLTVSDSRTRETDSGGEMIQRALVDRGHRVARYDIVKDEPEEIRQCLEEWIASAEIQVILTTGGTGISTRDTTIEIDERLLDKRLEGYGELFRMLSYQQVGSAAMLSRALGGLAGETLLFSMPGSPKAVKLALEELILPELPHLLWERSR